MPKLGVFSGREVCLLLAKHGFVQVRQKGSHVIMRNVTNGRAVPVPDHAELAKGTLASIIRQSGIAKSLFEEGS
jgi:predicted RNA binding protein YcfA (HicA-like mRNA interferase family)